MENKDSEILPADGQGGTPCDFNELESTMGPDFSADTLSVYLESCEPFSVTDPELSHNLDEPNIPRTDALVDPFNSIVLTESNSGRFNHVLENKTDKTRSSSTRKSTRKSASTQKTDTKLAARRSKRTSGKKPMLDLLAADVGRRRRSDMVPRARPSAWGLGGKIDEIFKQNAENNVNVESRKSRTSRKGGKKTTDFVNQSIQNKGLLLKFKLGTKAVQNCQLNMIPGVDTDLEIYRAVKIEPLKSDIKENYEKEVLSASDENLDKRVSLEASVIDVLLADRERSEDLSVENSCLDPGTSPDSEVINVIPDTQISGTTGGDCGVGSGIPSPEIINDEKQIEVSCSSGASMSITTGVASTLQETRVGASIDILTIESGTKTDLNIAGMESMESHSLEKLLLNSKSNNLEKSSSSKGITKNMSGVLDLVNEKRQKGSQAKEKFNCDMESHPITEEGSRSTGGAMVPSEAESRQGSPLSAWVCCDDCHKWRRISAMLADSIESTECRWICKDNMDKAFADCSIPQEKSNADINEELELSEASCEEDTSNTRLNSNHSGQKQQDPPQPSWKLIKTNMFLHRNRKNQTIDEIMVCHCKPPLDGRMGCRDECLNRILNIECVKGTCPCGEFCSNQQFQKRKYSKLKCFPCGKKGYGLQLQEDIPKGRFLIEYVGEVLDMPAYDARQREYASKGHKHFYFMTLNGSEVIDACAKGNLGRFINHSCQPNCRTEKWMVNGEVCIGLFAIRDIKKGEELTFDYNYVRVFGAAAKKCVCGSARCRGVIGGDPLTSETVVLGDSDDEYPEPIYENISTKLDNLISGTGTGTHTAQSSCKNNEDVENENEPNPNSLLAIDDKLDDAAIPVASTEKEVSFERSSSESKIEEPDISFKVNEMKSESSSFDGEKHKKTNGGVSKKKPKSHKSENKCVILKPQPNTKLPSSAVKRGKSKTHKPPPEIDNKPLVLPQKPLTGRFEAVQEALNTLLNSDGGISKRRDGWKGYLKLLCLTAHSGNGEGIQSNRDLSMILDALLKTKSRTVLLDIINKNGLQMLHNLMKHYRKEFNKIPILRKLLKVLEFLAETKILTLENILKPSPNGAESFKESILSLTEHTDKQVHQIARNFRDRWIPWSARKSIRAERDIERMELDPPSNFRSFQGQNGHFSDRRLPEVSDNSIKPLQATPPVEASTASCVSSCTNRTRTRKRKSRWDEPGDVDPIIPVNKQSRLHDDTDAPPGFSSPVNRQLFPATTVVKGHLQDRYNSRLPTAFGVPSSFFKQTGGAAATVVAPAMTFHPFPPLPIYPRRCTDSNPGFERFRNPNTLGRRYYKQQKWHNSRSGQPWNGNKYGQNPPNMGGGYGGSGGFYEQQQQQQGL